MAYPAEVADVLALLIGLAVFAALFAFWRAGTMFVRWQPVAGIVETDDYSDGDRRDDRMLGGFAAIVRNDEDGERLVDSLVAFEDTDGVERRVTVSQWQRLGAAREGAVLVWYDPAHPEGATTWGPFVWLLVGVGMVVAAAVLVVSVLPKG